MFGGKFAVKVFIAAALIWVFSEGGIFPAQISGSMAAEPELVLDNKPGKNVRFDESSPYSIVIFSIKVADDHRARYRKSTHNMSVTWKKYDPETDEIQDIERDNKDIISVKLKDGNIFKKRDVSEKQYRVFRLWPGSYKLTETTLISSIGNTTSINRLSYEGNTISFQAEAGKIYFIGDYEFTFFQSNRGVVTKRTGYGGIPSLDYAKIDLAGHNMEEMQAFFKKYKKMEGEIIIPEITPLGIDLGADLNDALMDLLEQLQNAGKK